MIPYQDSFMPPLALRDSTPGSAVVVWTVGVVGLGNPPNDMTCTNNAGCIAKANKVRTRKPDHAMILHEC
jgi:hypothetical protein